MSAAPREPFDREEARLAQAYARLPAGEPSRALDERILAQARKAVAPPARRRPWFLGAGFGAAAAAVMAAGMAWQLGWLGGIPEATREAAPRDAQGPAAAAREERIEVEYIGRAPLPETAPEAKAAADAAAPPERRQRVPQPPAAAAPPPPPPAPASVPAPPAAPVAPPPPAEAMESAAEPQPQAFPAERAAVAGAAASAAKREGEADQIVVSGTRLTRPAATLPPWTEDAALAPDDWLERVRERVRLGDRQGAEHSLRRFVMTHPRRAVPQELQRLLVE